MKHDNKKWAQLAQLATLSYDKELAKLSELRAAQAKLTEHRTMLQDMDERAKEAFAEPHPAHWHNGDFLWQTWISKNKRAIGIEQARLRAIAEFHKPELKKAFGRKSVLESLSAKKRVKH